MFGGGTWNQIREILRSTPIILRTVCSPFSFFYTWAPSYQSESNVRCKVHVICEGFLFQPTHVFKFTTDIPSICHEKIKQACYTQFKRDGTKSLSLTLSVRLPHLSLLPVNFVAEFWRKWCMMMMKTMMLLLSNLSCNDSGWNL